MIWNSSPCYQVLCCSIILERHHFSRNLKKRRKKSKIAPVLVSNLATKKPFFQPLHDFWKHRIPKTYNNKKKPNTVLDTLTAITRFYNSTQLLKKSLCSLPHSLQPVLYHIHFNQRSYLVLFHIHTKPTCLNRIKSILKRLANYDIIKFLREELKE